MLELPLTISLLLANAVCSLESTVRPVGSDIFAVNSAGSIRFFDRRAGKKNLSIQHSYDLIAWTTSGGKAWLWRKDVQVVEHGKLVTLPVDPPSWGASTPLGASISTAGSTVAILEGKQSDTSNIVISTPFGSKQGELKVSAVSGVDFLPGNQRLYYWSLVQVGIIGLSSPFSVQSIRWRVPANDRLTVDGVLAVGSSIVACTAGGRIQGLSPSSMKPTWNLRASGSRPRIAWSRHSKLVIISSDGPRAEALLQMIDVRLGKVLVSKATHLRNVLDLCLTEDGRYVYVLVNDYVHVLEAKSLTEKRRLRIG